MKMKSIDQVVAAEKENPGTDKRSKVGRLCFSYE
jgi:hypothetical protein